LGALKPAACFFWRSMRRRKAASERARPSSESPDSARVIVSLPRRRSPPPRDGFEGAEGFSRFFLGSAAGALGRAASAGFGLAGALGFAFAPVSSALRFSSSALRLSSSMAR